MGVTSWPSCLATGQVMELGTVAGTSLCHQLHPPSLASPPQYQGRGLGQRRSGATLGPGGGNRAGTVLTAFGLFPPNGFGVGGVLYLDFFGRVLV